MTPNERLKEIAKTYEFGAKNNRIAQDIEWLINRVKRLTEALELIAKDFGTDHCDGNTMIAKKALGNE